MAPVFSESDAAIVAAITGVEIISPFIIEIRNYRFCCMDKTSCIVDKPKAQKQNRMFFVVISMIWNIKMYSRGAQL